MWINEVWKEHAQDIQFVRKTCDHRRKQSTRQIVEKSARRRRFATRILSQFFEGCFPRLSEVKSLICVGMYYTYWIGLKQKTNFDVGTLQMTTVRLSNLLESARPVCIFLQDDIKLTCWKRAFRCLGLASSMVVGASSGGSGRLVREASSGRGAATGAILPPPPARLPRDPRGDPSPCEPLPHNTLPSPEALFRTPALNSDTPPLPAPPPPLPSRGFTYKFDESTSHVMSPSEGKGCVRHDANVSAT